MRVGTSERWRVVTICPDHRPEERSEVSRCFVGAELEIDDHVAGVVDRSEHAMGTHACSTSRIAESIEWRATSNLVSQRRRGSASPEPSRA